MTNLAALVFGLLFGAGLLLSGMTDPEKVLGFLDVAGAWDPSLAFVMGGAVLSSAPFFTLAKRRGRPLFTGALDAPEGSIDTRLILGAATFGVGWGLSGLCPGPVIVNIGIAPLSILPFISALAVGLLIARAIDRKPSTAKAA